MYNFLKNAAKRKPATQTQLAEVSSKSITLETIQENEDITHIWEMKSRLSLKLSDIMSDQKSFSYFVQFMQSIEKIVIIKCWYDLERCRASIANNCNNKESKHINRTRSLDLDSSGSIEHEKVKLTSSKTRSKWTLRKKHCSSNSCQNLAEQIPVPSDAGDSNANDVTDEAVSLFKKYLALEAPQPVDIPDNVRKTIISNICQPQKQLQDDCFQPVLELLQRQMEEYFLQFQQSPLFTKAQIDLLTNDSLLNLNDIVFNETVLFYFTEYLEQESCSVLLELLIALINFRENMMNCNCETEQAQEDALIIYEKYFSLQATSPIGFTSDVRLKVESEICREGGPLHSCFDIPYRIVHKTLSQHVKTFLESDVYYKYLTEMMNSVENWSSNQRSHSDCSSEFSISTQNTLLAMGDPAYVTKKRVSSASDMTIDSRQLYDADSLWRRKKHDGLSLGRVNSLGRFESKLEPDPDRRETSVLKKMVSRLVPSAGRVEEEMAWQIAHMIVKDVTDLTMAPPDN